MSAFWRFWAASSVARLGGGTGAAAFPLAAAALSSEPIHVAGIAVALELPWLLFGLPAGALADRRDRRTLAVAATATQGALVIVLAVAMITGVAGMAMIYAAAFGMGTCATFAGSAVRTMTPALVEPADLERANGRIITAGNASGELVGPPLGSALFGLVAAVPFFFQGLTNVAATFLLGSLPDRFAPGRQTTTVRGALSEIWEGIRWLVGHRRLGSITVLTMVFVITDSAWFALLALYVTEILHLPPSAYGIVVGIAAAGGLVGGLAAATIARVLPTHVLLPGLLVAAAAGQVVLAVTGGAVVATAALAVSAFAFGIWDVVTVTQFQRHTPNGLMGRVMAADRTAIMGASPLGALLGGLAANAWGLRAPLLLGLPILLGGAFLGWRLLRTARLK
ncbi:MFS transporter [Tenggerimyces flavus]|uniref:MFS transporter n=1 Tax=Tenggerimyces flavus TaxID=1708749 RepID=A0ABV7Y7T7_9ACTN